MNLASGFWIDPIYVKDRPVTARKAESTEDTVQKGSAVESEIDNLVHKDFRAQRQTGLGTASEINAEGVASLITRVAGQSADEIDGLIAELHQVRNFLRAEGERVQRKINEYVQMNHSALASIKIIADAIGPWKSATLDKPPPLKSNEEADRGT